MKKVYSIKDEMIIIIRYHCYDNAVHDDFFVKIIQNVAILYMMN